MTESSVGFRRQKEGEHTKGKLPNIVCFFVFGYVMVILSEVVSTALPDPLAGSSFSKEKDDKLFERTTFAAKSAAVVIAGLFHELVKLSLPCPESSIPFQSHPPFVACILRVWCPSNNKLHSLYGIFDGNMAV